MISCFYLRTINLNLYDILLCKNDANGNPLLYPIFYSIIITVSSYLQSLHIIQIKSHKIPPFKYSAFSSISLSYVFFYCFIKQSKEHELYIYAFPKSQQIIYYSSFLLNVKSLNIAWNMKTPASSKSIVTLS